MEQCSTSNDSPHFALGHHPQFRNELYVSSDKRDDVWQGWYALAEDYYAAHGDLLLSRNYTIRGNHLGRWIERQRAA